MNTWQIVVTLVVVVAFIYGAKKLIASENHRNDSPDTERDNNTDAGIQEVKKKRNI